MTPALIGLGLTALATALACAFQVRRWSARHPEPLWDWDKIDTSEIYAPGAFPDGFTWGTATAAYQVEGGIHNNNWSWWETQTTAQGKPTVHGGDKAGDAAQHYQRFREDIERMKQELGVGAYRFSVEFARIEPEPGQWDEDAIRHYGEVVDACIAAGIEPMITIHHFTHPLWFEQLGSFEKRENLKYIVRFAQRCFGEWGDRVHLWCTHNEPGPFATMGWGLGVFPPGKKTIGLLSQVLCNLMHSHAAIYQAIKAMPHGQQARVGLVKNIFQFDPYHRWNPVHWVLCRLMDEVYNESILRYMRTGRFTLKVPFFADVDEEIPGGAQLTDFFGLNYYANLIIDPFMPREPPFEPRVRPGQVVTDMPYAIYAEGFHRALQRAALVGRPILVTENGIADAADDKRALWIERYLYAMKKAIDEGVEVEAYYYWSFMDNFEWAEGYAMRFGLYAVDYGTQERRLREGSQAFVRAVRASASK